MREKVAALGVVALLAGSGCRQLAGLDDLVPPPEAGARDVHANDVHAADVRGKDHAGPGTPKPCSCAGCTILAEHLDQQPLSLLVQGGFVYFLNYGPEDAQGSLMRVPTKGGKVDTVVGGLNRPFSIAADSASFYWLAEDSTGGIVVRQPIAGGAPTTLASGLPHMQDLIMAGIASIQTTELVAVTATDVYFIGFAPGSPGGPAPQGIFSVPIDGGAVQELVSTWPGDAGPPPDSGPYADAGAILAPLALATDGTRVFATSIYPQIGVLRVPLPAGPAVGLLENLSNPWALVTAGSDVYFIDDAPNFMSGTLQQIGKDGGVPQILVHDDLPPWDLAYASGTLYVLDTSTVLGAAAIKAYDLGTKKLTTLADLLQAPTALAVDTESVYWLDPFCGTLTKVAR